MGFCRSTSAVAPDDPLLEPVASKASSKGKRGFRKKGSGRLEGPPAPEAAPSRDGLHSAPSGDAPAVKQDPVKVDRAGLHSAPAVRAVQPAVPTEEALPNPKQLGDFLLESADGVTAAEADAYLSDIIGACPARRSRARVGFLIGCAAASLHTQTLGSSSGCVSARYCLCLTARTAPAAQAPS